MSEIITTFLWHDYHGEHQYVHPVVTMAQLTLQWMLNEQRRIVIDGMFLKEEHIKEFLQQEQYLARMRQISENELEEIRDDILGSITDRKLYDALIDIWYYSDIINYDDPEKNYFINKVKQALTNRRNSREAGRWMRMCCIHCGMYMEWPDCKQCFCCFGCCACDDVLCDEDDDQSQE